MEIASKIREIAEKLLEEPGHFLVDVLFFEKMRPAKVMVIVDGDNGVNIDALTSISRRLAAILDERNIPDHAYTLEVTTPGIDQPLKLKRQFFKNTGRQFKVTLKDKSVVQGKLESVTEEKLTIRQQVDKKETKLTEVPFDQVEKALVQVSFK